MKYDIIIVGGGINGSGIARDAALRGLKVILIEKHDFAFGASGNNSQMIHGGVRYLLSEVHTTKLSCLDSGYIQKITKPFIFRIPFLFPIPAKPGVSSLISRLKLEGTESFFEAYDRFVPLKNGLPHARFNRSETLRLEPSLNPDIVGAVTFDEWGIDSPRLNLLNALSAHEAGAEVRNHSEVLNFIIENKSVKGVKLRNNLNGSTEELYAHVVVNATGAWSPQIASLAGVKIKMRPAKGVHITLDRKISPYSILASAIDGRSIFVMPHKDVSIIGTTDDDFFGSPDDVPILEDEVEYLLEGIESVFPNIRKERIRHVWAGVRPTLYARGPYEDHLSREYEIYDHAGRDGLEGLFSVIGGKLASYRLLAEDMVNQLCSKLGRKEKCSTHLEALPGAEAEVKVEEISQTYQVPPWVASRLIYRYGSRVHNVFAAVSKSKSRVSCSCEPVLEAEIRYQVRQEWARTLEDLSRRSKFSLGSCMGTKCFLEGAMVLGDELGMSSKQIYQMAEEYLDLLWRKNSVIYKNDSLKQEELKSALRFLSL